MSAIYLFVVLSVWGWLTWLLWKTGRRFLRSGYIHISLRLVLIAVVAVAWFGGSFWEVGGKKLYWDAKVRELCANEGGVRVYETVELPGEMFNNWEQVKIPSDNHVTEKDSYFYKITQIFVRKGSPEIYQLRIVVVRRSDNKQLGEAKSFTRRGGDIPGPWHKSSFTCPNDTGLSDLKKQIFFNNNSERGGS